MLSFSFSVCHKVYVLCQCLNVTLSFKSLPLCLSVFQNDDDEGNNHNKNSNSNDVSMICSLHHKPTPTRMMVCQLCLVV